MFYLAMHSTHFIYGYMASDIMVKDHSDSERKPAVATRATLSDWTLETILTCLYPYTVQTRPLAGTASGMASDSVRGRGFLINSNGSFICTIPQTG